MDAVKFLEERKRMFKSGNPVPGLDIDITYNNASGSCATMKRECKDCRREFWMQEVE